MVAWSHHLLPILDALPEERRGHLYAPTNLRRDLPDGTRFDLQTMWAGTAPLLVAGPHDLNQSRRRKVFASHGSGQCYAGVTDNPSYDGGAGRELVDLFLTPNALSAERNLARYPRARAAVVGCPKLDRYLEIPKPHNERPVVAVAWHWNCSISQESGWAWPTWREPVEQLVATKTVTILGHGHPRARRELEQWYASIGVEAVWDVEELLARADMLVVDNSSLAFEFAACDRPVIFLDDASWRRDVYHGLRFGDQLPGPRLPFKPPHDQLPLVEQLAAAIAFRWEHPDMEAPARRNVTERVYGGVLDGKASARAAQAILDFEEDTK